MLNLKLGRKRRSHPAPRKGHKLVAMCKFLATIPAPPTSCDNTFGLTTFGMMLNDTLGDCVCAADGHSLQIWSKSSGSEITIPDAAVETAYEQACGYNPSDPSTDQGCIIDNVLQFFKTTGIGGYKITDFADLPLTLTALMQGIYLFGIVSGGVELPLSAQSQVGSLWDVVGDGQTGNSAPGSWGGHNIDFVGYDSTSDTYTCITWGALQKMTSKFITAYFDEFAGLISPLWNGPYPTNSLENDLSAIAAANSLVVSMPSITVNP